MRYVVRRLLWAIPTLFGISLLTFALLELAPLDARSARALDPAVARSEASRVAAVRALQERVGMVDPRTGARRGVWVRYLHWLEDVARLELAPSGETPASFRRRLGSALAFSALLAGIAFALAVVAGVTAGAWLGWRQRPWADRLGSVPLLLLGGLPDFLVATLAILAIGGSGLDLPLAGLRSPGTGAAGRGAELADLAAHLALPASILALAPAVAIARYLRASLRATRDAEWVFTLRAWGAAPRLVRRRARHAAMRPLWTQFGTLLPMLLTGAVVVEEMFRLPGFGRLTFRAVLEREVATVTATTLIGAALVLVGLLASDLLHRRADPRVVLR